MEKIYFDTKFYKDYYKEDENIISVLSSYDHFFIMEELINCIYKLDSVLLKKKYKVNNCNIFKNSPSITKIFYLLFIVNKTKFSVQTIEVLKNLYFLILGKTTYHVDFSILENPKFSEVVETGKSLNIENIHIFTIESEVHKLFTDLSLNEIKYILCFFYNLYKFYNVD